MINFPRCILLAAILSLTLSAAAQSLTGTVTNGTSKKPGAGDDVILINLSNGMDVEAKTKADAEGKFSFKLAETGPHLIRAIHQGVTYHQMAPPGVSSVDVNVYDVASKVTGLSVTADVLRVQADGSSLQGIRLFVVNNSSTPAKTQMNDHNFEFFLPPGAKVEQVQARAPNGQPISAEATPQAEKNRYAIAFPLRPGETQFQLEYTLPYTGQLTIDPKPLYPAEHLVVILPKTMQFKAANPPSYNSMPDSSQGTDNQIEVAQQTKPGQPLSFTVTGTGTINDSPAQNASGSGPQEGGAPGQGRDNRPGGGLGVPIDAPDALQQYRWPILGGFALLLAFGGWIVTKRQTTAPAASGPVRSATPRDIVAPNRSSAPPPTTTGAPAAKSSMLLEALKEEMFQLELEKKQGKITPADYEKARSALDQTLDRALKRQT